MIVNDSGRPMRFYPGRIGDSDKIPTLISLAPADKGLVTHGIDWH